MSALGSSSGSMISRGRSPSNSRVVDNLNGHSRPAAVVRLHSTSASPTPCLPHSYPTGATLHNRASPMRTCIRSTSRRTIATTVEGSTTPAVSMTPGVVYVRTGSTSRSSSPIFTRVTLSSSSSSEHLRHAPLHHSGRSCSPGPRQSQPPLAMNYYSPTVGFNTPTQPALASASSTTAFRNPHLPSATASNAVPGHRMTLPARFQVPVFRAASPSQHSGAPSRATLQKADASPPHWLLNPAVTSLTSLPPFFYEADTSDPIDVAVLQELVSLNLEASTRLNIKRLKPGSYEIEGGRMSFQWRSSELYVCAGVPGEQKQSEEMPLRAFLRQLANVK
eukprot:TRINITY_DN87160_c0_g1_i1.p1 TRINITY_DN87160_c0_g1~~TRINITY_DN87160_c0_g1_i1.p1  ORF type:complete len:347 (+),score=4.52 TRINITY_DN87160_c0_g1_i1:37-1041(+)